jgi:hypothetical protein
MHSCPTHHPSRNQLAVASTGNRWTAILGMLSFEFRQRVIAETRRGFIFSFLSNECKERRFLCGLQGRSIHAEYPMKQWP